MTIREWVLSRLPPNIRADAWTRALLGVSCKSLDQLAERLVSVYKREFFQQLTPEMCDYWEELLGLPATGLSIAGRRSRITAAYLAGQAPTVENIKNIAESYEDGSVDVEYSAADRKITLSFNGEKGVPDNEDELKAGIARIAPAHILIVYAYLYLTCADVEAMTCAEVNATPLKQFAGRGNNGDSN